MTELLFAPTATVVAHSSMDPAGLAGWAAEMGYGALIDDATTPLGDIAQASTGAGSADVLPEFAGRFCYRSFKKGRPADEYVAHILDSGHGSVLEHVSVSFAVTGVSRALTHELIRHRAGTAVSQESQRYVDAKSVNFVVPPLLVAEIDRLKASGATSEADALCAEFLTDCESALGRYKRWQESFRAQVEALGVSEPTLIKKRANEAARCILPNATETRLVWTMNLRSARHVVELRGHRDADLEIRRLSCLLARKMKEVAPLVFADVGVFTDSDGFESVAVGHHKV
ncbi:thymidylate synthase (FAD) [Rhodospirillum rubrum]|uniref:FAD-dependent thymidylate synthase n=1 Tax=Rhodospirillum rubrum TaxID=1085 RepID=UPI001903AE44|nr:FAD-dependent thymidylate synthase [Rhodospirillum rubrum]MBK1663904.1 thymidylate synthase (FAD) [Rhodospirillum rubrum]MBK1678248.1 thymidylate synthase (FAD) [Rhodospirillum rubrum]